LTANDFETSFAITDPTADNTITFQNTSGTVAFLSDIGGGGSLFTDDGTVTYLTSTTDDLAIGAATLVAPFSVDVDTNILRVGDGTSDVNDPTITFYASDATDSGSISFVDADDFLFTGGDLTFAQNTIIGDGGDTLALDSSDWDINATGDLSGIGTLVSDGIATFSANLNANGGLDVDDAFVVADGGVLTTSAAANFDNTADFDGNVLVSDTDVAFDGVSTTFTTTGAFTLTPGGAVVLGDGVDTMQVNTSDWDVSITGDLTGIGSLTMDGVFSGATSIATTGDLTVSGGDITGSNGEIFDIGTTNSQFVMEINTDSTATLTVSDITDANTPFTISAAGTGTLTLSSAGAGSVAVGDGADTVSIDSSDWDISATGDLSGIGTLVSDGIATFSANLNANGGMDVDDAFVVADGGVLTTSQTANFDGTVDFDSLIDASAGVVQGASPLVFEGLTANDFETTFAITDPTADNIITFQNGTGTVAFLTDVVGGSSLFTDGGTVSYLTSTTDDLAVGGTALASPFSVDVDINTLRIGDGANDVNNPTVTFYASDATDSGSLSYLDTDGWFFSGGDVYVGNDSESISSTEFSLSGNDVYLEDSLGVNGTIYGDDGLKILGEFNQNIDILNAGSTITTGITGMFKSTFTGALSAARQDTGLYTTAQSDVSVTTQDYTFVGDYVRAKWDPGAPGITPTGSVNIYGRLTDFTTGNITNLDNLIGHRFSIGEGNSINDTTISNAGFIDGRFIPGSGTAITNFKGIYLSADDNSGAGTINDARGLDVSFTDAGAASFTSAYGIYVSEVQATNAYGVYVASVTGSSNDYSVYTADNAGNAAFLDNVFVGATSEDITDGVFTVGGDDFFVSGQLGVSDLMRLEASFAGFSGGFFNDGGLDDRQGVYIQGCLDTSPTTACNFLELRDGDGTVIGAIEGNGAGGVTNSSAGSDYAELFPGVLAHFSQGDILALDEEGNVTLATQTNDLIGAYSVSPNVLGNWVEGWETIGNAVPVALLGQVPVQVNDEGGSITIGDYLTLSSVPGVAKKATGVGFMLGRALASHSSGNGTILVFIEPTWQALDLVMDSNGTTELRDDVRVVSPQEATQQVPIVNSPSISLRGSVWNESVAQALEMKMKTVVQDPQTYRLSVSNTAESEVAYVTNEGLMRIAGDMIIGGRIYPSDRGVPQTEKYIYYDGSEGSGGDFMRTNAKGWSTGSYDFAEMFFSNETLKAGEVVVFDKAGVGGQVHRSTGLEGEQLAGIVSTRPGFLAGENNKDNYPIALAGRVPTRVNLQGGAIAVGDPLAASTEIGVATKATKPGSIIGYALEAYDGRGDGLMLTFVNMSYWGGAAIPQTQNTASQVSTQRTEFTNLNVTGDISMNGYAMLNVGRLVGFADTWSIESDGTIQTQGLIKNTIASHQGEMVETIAVVSPEAIITLSGTAELVQGEIEVRFEDVAPEYNDVISATAAIRVVVTPDGPVSLYVSEKDQNHFVVKRFAGEEDSSFDWIVTAYRRGYEPVEEEQPEETIEVQTTQSEPSQENQSGDEISESEESVQIVEEQVTEESQTQEVSQEEEEMTQKTEDPSTPETSVIQEEVVITP
ncbi:TPA: hypothetical protein DCW61_02670, partial [Candidatus Uhrbacteria bacterium]|nr:hypothetical protein [Candidatus Uhrbacteria bacterium]